MNELDEMYETEERADRQKHDDKLKELAKIQEAVNWQKQYKDWMYQQREQNELGADYFSYQGYHPPKK